jgi:hypothetical protein
MIRPLKKKAEQHAHYKKYETLAAMKQPIEVSEIS